jgi:NAD(P)-dependent dehydrogenase (short-subunit alcohol dehydrogenase family)
MAWQPDATALAGKVCVVAGATRGAGRGTAIALGEAGATVVCTGRTSATGALVSDYDRTETIEETADLVSAVGGIGRAVVVDHLDPVAVGNLTAKLQREYGHIDVLVNDIWGGELLKGAPPDWERAVWQHPLDDGLRMLRLAIDTHLITSHHLLPLMVDQPGGLLVEVTDGPREYNGDTYRISVFYDLAKTSVDRLGFSQGHELARYGATAVSITPGWLRSEMMLEAFGVTEDDWASADRGPGWLVSESPRFVGRAIAALAADPDRARWNQASLTSGGLAKEYGFCDIDGSQPDVWAFMADSDSSAGGESSGAVDPDPSRYR